MHGVLAVLKKEWTDHARDRRSLTTAFTLALFGPLVFAVMFTVVAGWMKDDRPLELAVQGRAHAPNLVAFLERRGVTVQEAPADAEERVKGGKLTAVLVVPEGFGEDFTGGHTASVRLLADSSRNSARAPVRRVRALLDAYAGMIGAQRLLARGVAPELAAPVAVEEVDLSTPEKQAASVLNMVPLFVLLVAFMGGMSVAIDATAGERERGSLEPLLLNPVPRATLVAGKWLAASLMAVAAVAVTLAAYSVMVRLVPLQDLGVKATLGPRELGGMALALLPLALLASALQLLVATFARSYKEAQTYLQLFLLVPMVPGMLLALSPIEPKAWMYGAPLLGQDLLLSGVMRGEPPAAGLFVLAGASALLTALACLAATAHLLTRDRIIFGRG